MSLPELLQEYRAASASGDALAEETALGKLHRALSVELPGDPLLAASCLAVIQSEELAAALRPIAERARPRSGRAKALVVDPTGRGRVVEVLVELAPGGAGAWTPQAVSRDATVAAELAVAVVLGAEAGRWGVRWQVIGAEADEIAGTSLGLPVAVATRAAQLGRSVDPSWAFTGAVALDGRVGTVSGLAAKLRAAVSKELATVVVPAADLTQAGGRPGLIVLPVDRLGSLWEPLGLVEVSAPGPSLNLRPLVLIVPVLLAFFAVLDPVEAMLRTPLVQLLAGPVQPTDTAILGLPSERAVAELRPEYPQVIDQLVEAGARVIAFDVLLLSATEHDAAIADAISRAESAQVAVLLPSRWEGEAWSPPTPELEAVAWPAMVELEADRMLGRVRRAPVRLRANDGTVRWHIAVSALAARLDEEPLLDGRDLRVGMTRNATRTERVHLPVVEPSPRLDWDSPDWDLAAGRIVFVGAMDGRVDRMNAPWGPVYGVELHAALTETLAQQRALRLGRPAVDALIALLIGLATVLIRRRHRGLAVLPLVAGLVVVGGVAVAGTLQAWIPPILAAIAGWWGSRR